MAEKLSIDLLKTQKSLIDLSDNSLPSDLAMEDYVASQLFGDTILINFADISYGEGGECITRNGLIIPIGHIESAWRKGNVILVGPNVRQVKVGDIVVFPNKMGLGISNLEVKGHGKIAKGLFLNEDRIFMICEKKEDA